VAARTGVEPPMKIIIDEVTFNEPIHLSDLARSELLVELKQLALDATDDWLQEVRDGQLTRAWRDQGFHNAKVAAKESYLRIDSARQHVALTINVDEGLQYRFGEVTFRSADADQPLAFSLNELKRRVQMSEGDIFDESKVRESIEALKVLYGSSGYIDLVTTPLVDTDDESQRISLVMELDQEKQFRIGEVEGFTSNPKFKGIAESRLRPDDVFDARIIKRLLKDNCRPFAARHLG
jgi:outer membrane protein assembly factor BamA